MHEGRTVDRWIVACVAFPGTEQISQHSISSAAVRRVIGRTNETFTYGSVFRCDCVRSHGLWSQVWPPWPALGLRAEVHESLSGPVDIQSLMF